MNLFLNIYIFKMKGLRLMSKIICKHMHFSHLENTDSCQRGYCTPIAYPRWTWLSYRPNEWGVRVAPQTWVMRLFFYALNGNKFLNISLGCSSRPTKIILWIFVNIHQHTIYYMFSIGWSIDFLLLCSDCVMHYSRKEWKWMS